ncbi:MAG TPA: hypothetical protein VMH86_14710 [Rhizomicrobium sp.]|nr:hypothetical protein [Rhizomicrobium sp.]
MPARKGNSDRTESVGSEEKIARLLALHLVRSIEDKAEQIATLDAAGFERNEIAELLGIRENNVSVTLHRRRKKMPKR